MPEQITTQDKYHQSITTLPLNRYIEILIEKDLSHLVISGEPSPDDLAIAWSEIMQEYSDAMGDSDMEMYLSLAKELALLDLRYNMVENCVKILQCVYEKKYADEVNSVLRTSFAFDWTDQTAYQKELIRCLNRNKTNKIQIELKKAQLVAQEQKFESKGKAPTREYFISVLISLSDHAKYQINDDITVYQFCDRIRRLNAYITQLQDGKH